MNPLEMGLIKERIGNRLPNESIRNGFKKGTYR